MLTSKALKSEFVIAVIMLIISVLALASSTFAWFANSKSVQAKNISVTAECDVSFLEIGNEKTYAANGDKYYTGSSIEAEADHPNGLLYPVTPLDEDTLNKDASGNIIWRYTYSNSVVNYQKASTIPYYVVGNRGEDINDYVLANAFYIRMAGNGDQGANFKASSVTCSTITTNVIDEAVRILIVGKDGYQIYDCGTGSLSDDNLISSFGYLADDVKTADQTIYVYVYYEGGDTQLFTDNLTTMSGVNISIEFTAERSST